MYATRSASTASIRHLTSIHTPLSSTSIPKLLTLTFTIPLTTTNARLFSTTQPSHLREFFPKPEAKGVKTTPAAWPHPAYTPSQMTSIEIAHREPQDFSDRVALGMMRLLRWGTDTVTRYHHHEDPNSPYEMSERKWMIRFIFLETVAGVPGMVGGMLRHFRSMRRMKRDNGWIETLLEEAYNERMHLLTFLKLAEPGYIMRFLVLGAQGVFFNAFFLSYLVSPRTCHRFVGYLEEEAVRTYTGVLNDMDAGYLPNFSASRAPDIAIDYWKMPEGSRSFRDLILYIRADEAKHREVNHTLGNLKQACDPNPYVSEWKQPDVPHPTKGIEYHRATGWEREEIFKLENGNHDGGEKKLEAQNEMQGVGGAKA